MRLKSHRNKGYKIPKYDRIFDGSSRRRKKKIRNTVIFVIVVLLLVFVGYSISGPLVNLLKGEKTERPGQNSSSTSSLGVQNENTSSSLTSSETPTVQGNDLQAVYLPLETAKNAEALSAFLANVKAIGYNSVVLELKDENGTLYYQSQVEMAKNVGAVSASAALNVSQIVSQIKEASLVPVAKIHAFKDKIATKNADAKIRYKGKEGWSWFDAENGKPWLNPYSTAAQNYITSIALELADAGFENVMVSSVMFPSVYSFALADFGALEATVSHKDILMQYTASLKDALNSKNAKLLLSYDATQASNAENVIYGGADPKAFSADVYVPLVGADIVNSDASADTGSHQASKLEEFVSRFASGETALMVEISADALSKEQIELFKNSCKDCGIYIYNKNGNYAG